MKNRTFLKLCVAVSLIFALSFAAALIPSMQRAEEETFLIGFSFAFFSIRMGQVGTFSTHLTLAGLAGNICLGYALCCGAECLKKKGGRGDDESRFENDV